MKSGCQYLRCFATADGRQYSLQNSGGGGRATGNDDIYRNHVGDLTAARITFAENPAVAAAVAEGDYQLGVGRGVVSSFESNLHMPRHRAGDQQHIRMARAGNKVYAQPFDIIVGIVEAVDFQLATVAGASVNVTDCQCATDMVQNLRADLLYFIAQRIFRLRRRFGFDAGAEDLSDDLVHGYKSTPQ